MSWTRADSVTVNIDNMLNSLSSTPPKPSMFRVGDHLRSINPGAYDPEIIAIGPFHRSKPNLQNMEQHKVRDEDDPIFQYGHIQSHLLHDLMVFENQIPFFIIDHLFNVININDLDNINSLIWPLLQNGIFPVNGLPEVPINALHLLGIVHGFQCSSFARILSHSGNPDDVMNINSAVELSEAGISFKKSEGNSFFHIEFKNKALIIPEWEISDLTESLFRNLIAYEYYLTGSPQKYVTDYAFFMHCLVHSPEDVKLLRRSGIISSFLGSDEMVYHVINRLGKNIIISDKFSYSNIFYFVNRHCLHKWNIWMATLRREYFNSPWARISVGAAIFLLGLAIIQTVFAILSYRKSL
ncbi:Hypothetical predicted protein [Olea europaea subsp. europaea]|uniref:Uncharacterized protein n=1 Tax=Olea europaea subsp. europaea TaxID=158383 RepID=A0A8S0RC37_OLEEU|nr:Hypothetical predicted protein [Olea europaea subsp. europaea]